MVHILLAIIYIAFISLGLPDGLLGAGWPSMYPELNVPVSWMGAVSLLISGGTVVSSLMSDRLNRRFGTGLVTSVSVLMTAAALIGFSFSRSYWMLCLWAVPYGLGAGSVDSALNNYVAIHYAGKHMSWLHCMWGLGAASGPFIMGALLSMNWHWSAGYWSIGLLQLLLAISLFASLRIWKRTDHTQEETEQGPALSFKQILSLPGAKAVVIAFFCYCALEQTAGQWAGSYFFEYQKLSENESATLAALFYVGITLGRFVNGFLTIKFSDKQLVRAGSALILAGLLTMYIPLGKYSAIAGLLLAGFGCAPVYPCIIHTTPVLFGKENSQAIIGFEMASAYVGICVAPPVFGYIGDWLGMWCWPLFMMIFLIIMVVSHEGMYYRTKSRNI